MLTYHLKNLEENNTRDDKKEEVKMKVNSYKQYNEDVKELFLRMVKAKKYQSHWDANTIHFGLIEKVLRECGNF